MVFGPDERGDAVTFQESTWRATPPVGDAGGDEDAPGAAIELPPLPELEPLPAFRPLPPMPAPPWESAGAPERSNTHGPSMTEPAPAHPTMTESAQTHPAVTEPAPAHPTMTKPPSGPSRESRPSPRSNDADEFPLVRVPRQAPPPPSGHPAATPSSTVDRVPAQPSPPESSRRSGRHAAAEVEVRTARPGSRRVLLLGGSEPLGGILAQRLGDAGHRLAVHQVHRSARHQPEGSDSPVVVTGDRTDVEDMVQTVAGAEIALGGLDAVVITPAEPSHPARIDADPSTWSDSWSHALAADVLAVACAAHTAARSFIARRTAGRIVLVNAAPGRAPGDLAAPVTSAAVAALGTELTGALRPHGIGVSVVTEPGGSAGDFALAQVADVVQALLDTPVLSGVDTVVG